MIASVYNCILVLCLMIAGEGAMEKAMAMYVVLGDDSGTSSSKAARYNVGHAALT